MFDQKVQVAAYVQEAAKRLSGLIVETPLLENEYYSDRLGFRLLVKAEPLQRTNSFKIRGAGNFIARLRDATTVKDVVAFSSGNHGQGVAYAAKCAGFGATIVVPLDVPAIKLAGIKQWGAKVIQYENYYRDREEYAKSLADRLGAVIVPPYDHIDIIAGQGTIALEIFEQCRLLDIAPQHIFVPTSGGGLVCGIGVVARHLGPDTLVTAVEPAGFNDFACSIAAGERRRAGMHGATTICDGLKSPMPGVENFALGRDVIDRFAEVSDEDVLMAMRELFQHFRIVVEPSGAAAFASVLQQRDFLRAQNVIVVASGGNVDAGLFADMLNEAPR